MALCSLARKVMPVPAALRRAPPPSRSLHRLEGTASPKTITPTDKGRGSSFEEKNVEYFVKLTEKFADQTRYYRIMVLSAFCANDVVFFTLLALRNHESYLSEC